MPPRIPELQRHCPSLDFDFALDAGMPVGRAKQDARRADHHRDDVALHVTVLETAAPPRTEDITNEERDRPWSDRHR